MANGGRPWTKAEDKIVLKHMPRVAVKKLKGRTRASIKQRRHKLLNPKPKGEPFKPWSKEDVLRLRKHYPTCNRAEDILHLFPGRDAIQLRGKAAHCKIRKRFLGDAKAMGAWELVDQIRIRCKQDGISLLGLDRSIGVKRYFEYSGKARPRRKANMRLIMKAIEFFGGQLVIDWNDR